MSDLKLTLGDLKSKKVFDFENIKVGMFAEDVQDKDFNKIFTSIFDTDKDNKLSEKEKEEVIANFKLAAQFDEYSENLSVQEADEFLKSYNDLKGITADKLFKFLLSLKSEKRKESDAKPQSKSNNEEKSEDKSNKYSPYTVQNGESFKKLIMRAYGLSSMKDPKMNDAISDFKKNNPGALKTAKNGVQYLLVGAKVNLPGGLIDKNNSKEQIEVYTKSIKPQNNQQTKPTNDEKKVKNEQVSKTLVKSQNKQNIPKPKNNAVSTALELDKPDGIHKGYLVTKINSDGSYLVFNQFEKKELLCNSSGKVTEIRFYDNNYKLKLVKTVESNRIKTIKNYTDGQLTSFRYPQKKITVTYRTTKKGIKIKTVKHDDGTVEYFKSTKQNPTNFSIKCNKNGWVAQVQNAGN